MKLEWLKYRELTENYIRGANIYARNYNVPLFTFEDVAVSPAKIQVLEYILENEEQRLPMAALAERLGITRGAFTKHAARLERMGLLIKQHPDGNAKTYILVLTDKGRRLYESYTARIKAFAFDELAAMLDRMSPEEYEKTAELIKMIAQSMIKGK